MPERLTHRVLIVLLPLALNDDAQPLWDVLDSLHIIDTQQPHT
jgi:hypothetical protein